MPEVPTKREIVTTRHEWVIGVESRSTDAKDFAYGVHCAEKDMDSLGVNLSFDDAYHVRAGDGGEVILFVDVADTKRPGRDFHREGWCRNGDSITGPWEVTSGGDQCQTCGRTVGK